MNLHIADPASHDQYEQLFLDHLPMIKRTAAAVATRRRLPPAEIEEFTAEVIFRIISDDYAILRKFRGRSKLRTYIVVVVKRLCLDYHAAAWGKWRPSIRSRRNGRLFVELERLTIRDGLSLEQACQVLETGRGEPLDRTLLEQAYARFKPRLRPKFVPESAIQQQPATDELRERVECGHDHRRTVSRALRALAVAVRSAPVEDRLVLTLHFRNGLSIADVARALRVNQPDLYRRFTSLRARLRRQIESAGVSRSEVLAALGHPDA